MIELRSENGVVELTLGRAPCNEIGPELIGALEEVLDNLDLETTRVLIMHSTQRLGFSAGADLRALYASIQGREPAEWVGELDEMLDRIHRVFDRLDTLPVTTIGVIHGVCFGGGLELALTCDLRIAERSARFAFPELRLGLVPGFGGIPRLERDVGNAVSRDILLTGRSINAKKAVELGLASQMVGPGRGLDAARRLAAQSAKYDPWVVAQAKPFVKRLPRERLDEERGLFRTMIQRPVVKAALETFVNSTDALPYLA